MNKKNTIMKQLINICKEFNLTSQELSNYVDELYERPENDLRTTSFKLYDTIEIGLDDGELIRAVVIDINDKEHKVTFVLKNCFKDTSSMNRMDEFLASKYSMLPWSLMQIIENHSLRLLTYSEVFGDDRYPYFYNVDNRICYDVNGERTHWWLGTPYSSTYSELVYPCGGADPEGNCAGAGVRPIFTIIQK